MAGYWFPHDQKKKELFISSAVKAQEKVGGLGSSLKANPDTKKGISLEEATKRHNAIMESGGYHQDSSGKSITPHPSTSGSLKSQDAAQQKVVDRFNKGGPSLAKGLGAAASVLKTLDMLTGGQDTILPGSGHTYSSSYNPEMYIGRTV